MDYLVVVSLLIAGSLAAGWALARAGAAPRVPRGGRIALLLAGLFFAAYAGLGLYKLEALQMGAWDFGIYDTLVRNAALGQGLMTDYRGKFDHFSPVMLLFAPLYLVWDSPVWLVLIQSAAMAAAAPLLYLTARRTFPKGPLPLLLTAMYLFDPYYSRLALYDFHAECLFPTLLFAAFYCYRLKRMKLFFLLLALTPLIKEDFVIPLGAAGLWLLTQKGKRRWGIAALAAAGCWTLFVLKVYYPYILRMEYWHYGRYEILGSSAAETGANIARMIHQVLSRNSLGVALSLLVPFAFLPLFNWRTALLFWLPTLGIQLVSNNNDQQLLVNHYGAAVLAVTPLAALRGARTLRYLLRGKRIPAEAKRAAVAFAAILMLANHALFCDLPLSRFANYTGRAEFRHAGGMLSVPARPEYWREMARRREHADEFRRIMARFPVGPETTLICQSELAGEFLRRAKVYDVPELGLGRGRPDRADYFLFDRGNYAGSCNFSNVNQLRLELVRDPEYRVFNYPNGVQVFARKGVLPPDFP